MEGNTTNIDSALDLVFSYLYQAGNLTLHHFDTEVARSFCLPNNEVITTLSSYLLSYYKSDHRIESKSINSSCAAINNLLRCEKDQVEAEVKNL